MKTFVGLLFLVSLSFAAADVSAMTDGRFDAVARFVDPLIGTEGSGSEYGGMQPYTCVPFGSFHAVPMTRTNRRGFDGNEDCGQMSAWYIFSALGLYPLDPASGEYEIGSPLVESATLKIGAATLRIVVKGYAPDRWRVRRVMLNGKPISGWRVRHADLVKGGELTFEMEPSCRTGCGGRRTCGRSMRRRAAKKGK